MEILLRDAHGRIQGHYMDGQLDRSSVPGKNLTLGIDIDLQMLGERLLQHKIGAIVAIDRLRVRFYVWFPRLPLTLI